VLEVGAGDGRLVHFLAEALGDPVAAGDCSVHAAGGPSSAEFGRCPGSDGGRSTGREGAASAPDAAPQILVTASDDGSLGLHVSSPHRRAMADVWLQSDLRWLATKPCSQTVCIVCGHGAVLCSVMPMWRCGCRHLVALEGAQAAVARVQPHIVLVRMCRRSASLAGRPPASAVVAVSCVVPTVYGPVKRQHPVASSTWLLPLLCLKLWHITCTGTTSKALQHAGDVYVCALQASWMPLGVDWSAAFRACPAVMEYILVRLMRNARGF
jgi:hypothetical protein